MEYMESKMQHQYDAWDAHTRETYADGFEAGVREAAHTLRAHAIDYELEATESKRVSARAGAMFAATMLRSFANGLEMQADNVKGPMVTVPNL